MRDAVFAEEDTKGRSRTDVILNFMEYEYEKLRAAGLFVSADVFGAIINSDVNADSVGQIYGEMAKHLDYISPMIYPSHYSDGNYGIDHPDTRPYDTICAALTESRKELYFAGLDGWPCGSRAPVASGLYGQLAEEPHPLWQENRCATRSARCMTAGMTSGFCGTRPAPTTGMAC